MFCKVNELSEKSTFNFVDSCFNSLYAYLFNLVFVPNTLTTSTSS